MSHPSRSARERGSILVLALLVSASAAIAGMWMVLTADLNVRKNRYLVRAFEASRIAGSGLQLARERLGVNAGWNGGTAAHPEDTAQVVAVTIQPLGYLLVRANCVGAIADSTQVVQGDLRAAFHPALRFQVASAGELLLEDVTAGGYLRANGAVIGSGDVAFTGTLETLANAGVTDQVDAKQVVYVADALPPPPLPLAEYLARSSPLMSVPIDPATGAVLLQRVSLVAAANPFGAPNASGAYALDAGGRNVVMRDVYIEGTLTVHNTTGVLVERGYHHRRTAPHLATLLVDGPLEVRLQMALNELWAGYDFNRDGDLVDVHAPLIEGLVHSSGAFIGPHGGTVRGTILAPTAKLRGYVKILADPSLLSQPIVGYVKQGPWDIVVGSIGAGS